MRARGRVMPVHSVQAGSYQQGREFSLSSLEAILSPACPVFIAKR
jgi:hypothetical protein